MAYDAACVWGTPKVMEEPEGNASPSPPPKHSSEQRKASVISKVSERRGSLVSKAKEERLKGESGYTLPIIILFILVAMPMVAACIHNEFLVAEGWTHNSSSIGAAEVKITVGVFSSPQKVCSPPESDHCVETTKYNTTVRVNATHTIVTPKSIRLNFLGYVVSNVGIVELMAFMPLMRLNGIVFGAVGLVAFMLSVFGLVLFLPSNHGSLVEFVQAQYAPEQDEQHPFTVKIGASVIWIGVQCMIGIGCLLLSYVSGRGLNVLFNRKGLILLTYAIITIMTAAIPELCTDDPRGFFDTQCSTANDHSSRTTIDDNTTDQFNGFNETQYFYCLSSSYDNLTRDCSLMETYTPKKQCERIDSLTVRPAKVWKGDSQNSSSGGSSVAFLKGNQRAMLDEYFLQVYDSRTNSSWGANQTESPRVPGNLWTVLIGKCRRDDLYALVRYMSILVCISVLILFGLVLIRVGPQHAGIPGGTFAHYLILELSMEDKAVRLDLKVNFGIMMFVILLALYLVGLQRFSITLLAAVLLPFFLAAHQFYIYLWYDGPTQYTMMDRYWCQTGGKDSCPMIRASPAFDQTLGLKVAFHQPVGTLALVKRRLLTLFQSSSTFFSEMLWMLALNKDHFELIRDKGFFVMNGYHRADAVEEQGAVSATTNALLKGYHKEPDEEQTKKLQRIAKKYDLTHLELDWIHWYTDDEWKQFRLFFSRTVSEPQQCSPISSANNGIDHQQRRHHRDTSADSENSSGVEELWCEIQIRAFYEENDVPQKKFVDDFLEIFDIDIDDESTDVETDDDGTTFLHTLQGAASQCVEVLQTIFNRDKDNEKFDLTKCTLGFEWHLDNIKDRYQCSDVDVCTFACCCEVKADGHPHHGQTNADDVVTPSTWADKKPSRSIASSSSLGSHLQGEKDEEQEDNGDRAQYRLNSFANSEAMEKGVE